MLTVRHFALSAAVVMLLAGASYAQGASVAESPLYISGIEVDSKHPNIVYASTLGPDSVLKSTDAGKTWSVADTGLTNPTSPTDSEDLRVDALALDPRSPNVLYAGTGLGVFKTNDGAQTWKLASTGIDLGGGLAHRMYEGSIYAIAIDPRAHIHGLCGGPRHLEEHERRRYLEARAPTRGFLSVWASTRVGPRPCTRAQWPASILKTIDGGGSWRAIGPRGLRDGYFGHPIVVARRAPGTVYAGGSRGLFASANQGRTWKKSLSGGVGAIALDPSQANVLYVGSWAHGVLKSVDGGQTWSAPLLDGRSVTPSRSLARARRRSTQASSGRRPRRGWGACSRARTAARHGNACSDDDAFQQAKQVLRG